MNSPSSVSISKAASAADVPKVSRNRAPPRSSASHFHHDLRGTTQGARDLGNLREAKSTGHLRTSPTVTYGFEESEVPPAVREDLV